MIDLVIRIAAVVAATALVAAPYWRQIADLARLGWSASKAYRADVARVAVALALVAFAWGVIPVGVITSDIALAYAKVAAGVLAGVCGLALLSGRIQIPAWASGCVLVVSGALLLAGASLPHIPINLPSPITVPTTTKATACVYVYEKDAGPIHPSILAALDKINRDKKIPATLFEQDTKDGTGETPEQYKAALDAAKKATLPAFVVLSGSSVISAVSAPKELVVP